LALLKTAPKQLHFYSVSAHTIRLSKCFDPFNSL